MSDTIVRDAVRSSNRRHIFWSLVGMFIVLGVAIIGKDYLYNVLLGPFPADSNAVSSIATVDGLPQYYLTVTGDDVFDTTYYEYERNSKTGVETTTAHFAALVVNDRLLLVKDANAVADGAAPIFTGSLVAMPSKVRNQIITEIETDFPQAAGLFLPFMLDTADVKPTGFLVLAGGIVVLLVCLWLLLRAVGRQGNPASHPIMKGLARYGDPELMADEIESEVAAVDAEVKKRFQGMRFTRKWLVKASGSSFVAMPFDDIAWLYKMVTQRRVNGVPAGKSYAAHILDRYGVRMIVSGKEAQVNDVLQAVANRAPWAIPGYSKDVESMFKTNRSGFIAGVEQRKQQIKAQQGTK